MTWTKKKDQTNSIGNAAPAVVQTEFRPRRGRIGEHPADYRPWLTPFDHLAPNSQLVQHPVQVVGMHAQ